MSTSQPKSPLLEMLADEAAKAQSDETRDERQVEQPMTLEEPELLTAIRTIPAEVLSRIFNSVPPNDLSFLPASVSWGPSNISPSWRAFVNSTPSMWSNLNFPLSLSEVGVSDQRYLELAGIVLDRSGTHPLDISIDLEKTDISINILRLLSCHAQQWRKVELHGSCPFGFASTLSPIKGNLGNLESLTITLLLPRHLDVFRDAPRLQEVYLRLHSECDIDLPYSQLRSFTSNLLPSDPITFLRSCPHLSEFGYVGENEPRVEGHAYDVQFLNLLWLSVSHPSVLHRLPTPGLKELKYHLSNDVDTVLNFLAISRCDLTCLGIAWTSHDFFEPGPFVTLLQNLPNLEHLKIYDLLSYQDEHFDVYETLRLGNGAYNLVPELQELTLDTYNPSIFNPDEYPEGPDLFESVMLSRVGRLRRLTLVHCLKDIPQCVENLMKAGIDVVVTWDRNMELQF
ncbi:uncharacterized protein EV420DRAFT_749682 [Desarmillaria tabescens]|uniref:F-box domain-containing protein n=1 Tax=Armillaria tabescens TaxID=1929756 RepID=A0AA39JWQ6_ARMTA|nr:uncharacterized protein EV420DRAFT_749682 [Desarmillaria tabescens]KAK0450336.1 hypothetical protein EV420DRAFT_749682 [Desarmillaria tabescens]